MPRAWAICVLVAILVVSREVMTRDAVVWSREMMMSDFSIYCWVVLCVSFWKPTLPLKSIAKMVGSIAIISDSWRWLAPGSSPLSSALAKLAAVILTVSLLKAIRWPVANNRSD